MTLFIVMSTVMLRRNIQDQQTLQDARIQICYIVRQDLIWLCVCFLTNMSVRKVCLEEDFHDPTTDLSNVTRAQLTTATR
mmetsp:Transcript_2323/g.8673  ORF Transcript_2323/g.8673 Transcript_2323/m.8673 type:complete len:80 (+) Transcript_2323:4104-4343(+)